MASPEPSLDMRHTKLRPEEAALLAGEVVKPSWASRNEGIHERVSFEDTLWGFEMAGGAYYKTPLRIVYVKPGSRAEQACIRMGDKVLRIQGIDTSTLTLQEAHQLVQDAGINLQIAVTSPDDLQDAHYEYQDPLMAQTGLTAEQLAALERERIQKAIAKAVRCRDLDWPWVRRKFIIYRESNCFMVPSKYENQHREQYPELPAQKIDYFFPSEPVSKVKPKNKQNGDAKLTTKENDETKMEENGIDNMTADEVAVDYLSEEKEEINMSENEDHPQEDDNDRLQEEIASKSSSPEQKNTEEDLIQDQELEYEEENLNLIEKDDQETSNYELDGNNSHDEISSPEQNESRDDLVEESTNEKEIENVIEKDDREPSEELEERNNNEEGNSPEENYSWDDLIEDNDPRNENKNLIGNDDPEPTNLDLDDSTTNDNMTKSDDEIINSVLNGEENLTER